MVGFNIGTQRFLRSLETGDLCAREGPVFMEGGRVMSGLIQTERGFRIDRNDK